MSVRTPRSLRPTKVVTASLALAVGLAVYPLAAQAPRSAVEEDRRWHALPALPDHVEGGIAELEDGAVALAAQLLAVPIDGRGRMCSPSRLEVSWDAPGEGYEVGAHVEPIGPVPGEGTTTVNGLVVCDGAGYAYMGFEAWREDGAWRLAAVPFVDEEDEDHGDEHGDEEAHDLLAGTPGAHAVAPAQAAAPAPQPPTATPMPPIEASGPRSPVPAGSAAPAPRSVVDLASFGPAIDGYAAYEPQRTCSPAAKPGTAALRDQLLANYAGSRNLGISRGCHIGGQSEHKEGRALDWGVLVSRPAEKTAGDGFVAALLATDGYGNRHALARRMGVMYVIWNRQIWSAYRPEGGWRPYRGVSPHTDHVHVSLSWDGAMARTSFWSGQVTLAQLDLGHVAAAPHASAPADLTAPPRALPDATPVHDAGPAHDDRPDDGQQGHHAEPEQGQQHGDGGGAAVSPPREEHEGDTRHLEKAAQQRAEKEQRAAERLEEQLGREARRQAAAAERELAEAAKHAAREDAKAQREADRQQPAPAAPTPAAVAPTPAAVPARPAPVAATAPPAKKEKPGAAPAGPPKAGQGPAGGKGPKDDDRGAKGGETGQGKDKGQGQGEGQGEGQGQGKGQGKGGD